MYKNATGASNKGGVKRFAQQKRLSSGTRLHKRTVKRSPETEPDPEPTERDVDTLDIHEGAARERLPVLYDVLAQIEQKERHRQAVIHKIKTAEATSQNRRNKPK